MKNNKFVQVIRKTLKTFSEHEMNVFSGYATLYILMAMIPLLMLIITIVNIMPWFSAADFAAFFFQFMPDLPEVQNMLKDVIENLNSQSSALLASISALTTLWSASNGISAIQAGLQEIQGTKRASIKGKPMALLFTIMYVLLIPCLLAFQLLRHPLEQCILSILASLHLESMVSLALTIFQFGGVITLVLAVAVIVLTYTFLPYGKRGIETQLPGSIFTCIAAGVFTWAFSFFMGTFWKASSVYGSLAAIFLSAMWMKFIITILFYGASLNKALEN